MRKLTLLFTLLLTLGMQSAARADCTPFGCFWHELAIDDELTFYPPGAWVASGNVYHYSNGTSCYYDGNYAQFSGGWGTLTEVTLAPDKTLGDHYTFAYFVTVSNATSDPWGGLVVGLYDADTGQQLASIDSLSPSTALSCQRKDFDLGYHSDWKNRRLQIRFDGYSYAGEQFKLEGVQLWQSYPGH
jgi:hypothetical protein